MSYDQWIDWTEDQYANQKNDDYPTTDMFSRARAGSTSEVRPSHIPKKLDKSDKENNGRSALTRSRSMTVGAKRDMEGTVQAKEESFFSDEDLGPRSSQSSNNSSLQVFISFFFRIILCDILIILMNK